MSSSTTATCTRRCAATSRRSLELAERVEYYDPEVEGLPLYERPCAGAVAQGARPQGVAASGGSLIVESTEALTVIDVNTGKNVGRTNLEETVYRNNLEAAEEVARQLRLRDIGGIIVIDFIDMEIRKNRDDVIRPSAMRSPATRRGPRCSTSRARACRDDTEAHLGGAGRDVQPDLPDARGAGSSSTSPCCSERSDRLTRFRVSPTTLTRLRASSMYAVIKSGGKQYRVEGRAARGRAARRRRRGRAVARARGRRRPRARHPDGARGASACCRRGPRAR